MAERFAENATTRLKCPQRKCEKHIKIKISRYDRKWSQLVRDRDGACRKCGKKSPEYVLHAHHIIGRGRKSTRLLVENGITLCVHHHVFGDDSAHKVGKQFVIDLIGQTEYDRLYAMSLVPKKERIAVEEFLEKYGK